jgi:phosphoglycerol transferase
LLRYFEGLYRSYKSKRKSTEYWANLEDGIMMFRNGRPSFVKAMNGFSESETWGRWTVRRKSLIEFKHRLPSKFELVIRGYAFGENEGKPLLINIGKQSYSLTMHGSPCKEYKIHIENYDHSDSIEICSSNVSSPYELYNKQSTDKRKLGIAVTAILILKK